MSDNEKLDDIFTYSSVGINDVKEDATGENVRKDIGGISSVEGPAGRGLDQDQAPPV
jgi:hypothetical protein